MTRTELIEALGNLPHLDPVERVRVCPDLIDAAKEVLSAERRAAMLEATESGPHRITQTALAKRLGVRRSVVTAGIAKARASARTD